MLIIEVKGFDNLEKALKKFKKKFESTKIVKQLRDRKNFTKKSEKRRTEINKAIYIKNKYGE
jgi:small subunit ribosomal protein S21